LKKLKDDIKNIHELIPLAEKTKDPEEAKSLNI